MPIPWSNDIAKQYWERRRPFIADKGYANPSKINRNLIAIQKKEEMSTSQISKLRAEFGIHDDISPLSEEYDALSSWCRTLSWSNCTKCSSLIPEKLLPSFPKNTKCQRTPDCVCKKSEYIVPDKESIPIELRDLKLQHIIALRPFTIDTGKYEVMKHGYRRKTAIFRLTCSIISVEDKIQSLQSPTDKEICSNAFHYLKGSRLSSYSSFLDMRETFLREQRQPTVFDVFKWKGIECALWPNIYPFTSWCESIHDGVESRKSSKKSFLTKCFSPVLDYSFNFSLLQFVFDRWIFKTVTGAINSAKIFSAKNAQSLAFNSLQDKSFCKGYWQWQHRYLIDAVRQFGLPDLFITISPSEWSFPLPYWMEDISKMSGRGPTELPCYETTNFMHILEQIIRGYLCGANDAKWRKHLLNDSKYTLTSNINTYFYRFEFQKRGTVHVHCLVWLKNIARIRYEHIRAELPTDDAKLAYFVNKCQLSNYSPLPLLESKTCITKTGTKQKLNISHPYSAKLKKVRGYIDTVLCSLKSSMDIQTSNGKSMLLKYVSSYVSKANESFHSDVFFCDSLAPSTMAFKYAMSLDICEPEMWALLTNIKLSWTNATRKKLNIPNTVDGVRTNSTVCKYYKREQQYKTLSLLEWLRNVDEKKTIPTEYSKKKVVLVGMRYCSIFNNFYFFQFLVANFPHYNIEEILPIDDSHLPQQVLYFNRAVSLMPQFFQSGAVFVSLLESEGHKDHYLKTLTSFVDSLIDVNNLYKRHLLPNAILAHQSISGNISLQLKGNQLLFFNYFCELMKQRQEALITAKLSPCENKFPLVLGKPGTGKTHTIHKCIQHCLNNGLNPCVAVPTGTLACTYKELYGEDVTCDTLHGIFKFHTITNDKPQINWSLSIYDVIFIDEVSQVSVDLFHHILATVCRLDISPLLILSGDFAQQQPIATVNNRTSMVSNILSCQHCKDHLQIFNLTTQFRSSDDKLINFLHHIRHAPPTDGMLANICRDRVFFPNDIKEEQIYQHLSKHPDALVLTMTRRASAYINQVVVKNKFTSHPFAHVVMDDEQLSPIHRDMRLLLTQNVNKSIGFVNGQFVTVKSVKGNTIVAQHPNGNIINIFPWTRQVQNSTITAYPCLPGYACTISKVQGQTISKIILWIDTKRTPPGTAYVAFSRVRKLNDIYFLQRPTPQQFIPATHNTT